MMPCLTGILWFVFIYSMAYPAFVLDKASRQSAVKRLVLYDVGCMLHKHLSNRMSGLLKQFTFAVPAFHRFAHNMRCQVKCLTIFLVFFCGFFFQFSVVCS